jgi:DNA-binding MarR family transcriptional regulator
MADDFDLTRYLPYLVNRAGVRLAESFTAAIRAHGVGLQEWRVLAALRHRDGPRVSELAATTSIDVSTLSRLLGGMQKSGLVERRRPDNGDARVVTVHATPRARAIVETLVPMAQRYEAQALAGFTAAEIAALKAMLVRVYGNVAALEGAVEEKAA